VAAGSELEKKGKEVRAEREKRAPFHALSPRLLEIRGGEIGVLGKKKGGGRGR